MLRLLYNYSMYFYSLYLFIKHKNNNKTNCKHLDRLEKNIYNCGPIGVKLIQLLIMYDNILPDTFRNHLNYTLENCKVHSWDTTVKLYYSNFKSHIYDDYEININEDNNDKVIGSGSIGQVYKLYSKKLQKYVALKVKHPCIDKEIATFIKITNIVIRVFEVFITIPYKNIICVFLHNINIQKDFIVEAENTQRFKTNFKDDTHIIVPEIYEASNDVIIMSYHEGSDISTLHKKQLYPVSQDINFIILSSIVVHDFIHADLHTGNWKIQLLDNNAYNIIIYDCGLVTSTNNIELNKNIIFSLMDGNYDSLYNIALENYIPYKNEKPIIQVNKFKKLNEYINIITYDSSLLSSQRYIHFLKYCINNEIIRDKNMINLILTFIISSNIQTLGLNRQNKILNINGENGTKSVIIYYTYVLMLHKIKRYKYLHDILYDYVNTIENMEYLHAWLYSTFGHTDVSVYNDIINKLLYI